MGAIKGDSGEKLAKSALSTVLDLGVAAISAKAPFVEPFVDIGITIFKDLVLGSSPPPPFVTEDEVKKMLEKFQVTVQEDTIRLIANDAFKAQVKAMKRLMDKYDTHLRSSKDAWMQPEHADSCQTLDSIHYPLLCCSGSQDTLTQDPGWIISKMNFLLESEYSDAFGHCDRYQRQLWDTTSKQDDYQKDCENWLQQGRRGRAT